MPVELVFARQDRPVGLSTLAQVQALAEGVRDAAQTAAADAVAAAQPGIAQAAQTAANDAVAAAEAQIAADRQAAQDAAAAAESAAGTAATDAAAEVAPAAAAAIRAQVAADADRASAAASAVPALARRLDPSAASRGDSMVLASINGVAVLGLDAQGRLLGDVAAVAAAQSAIAAEATARTAGDAALARRFDPSQIARGDSAILATINDVPVMGIAADGSLLSHGVGGVTQADVNAAIAAALDGLPTGGGGGTPASPDLAGDVDAWSVWVDGDLVTFTARLWGDHPREYVRLANGDAWANGPSRARVRLAYGDGLANATTDRGPGHYAHVATLGDGEGQDGLNGAVPTQDAADLERAGAGYAGVVADQWLGRRTGALPLVGVRSEAVTGATLPQLRAPAGQPMLNLKRAVSEFVSVLDPYGRTAQVDAISILHGAADDSASYAADLLQLTLDVIAETGALSVHVMQPAGTWERGNFASALGTVQAWRDRGDVPLVVVSPLYWVGLRASTLATPDAVSMTMLAELDAIAGNDWHCPVAFQASRSGTTINVDFEVMVGATLTATVEGLAHSGGAITGVSVVAHPVSGRMTRLSITQANSTPGTLRYRRAPTGANPAQLANYGTAGIADTWSAASVTGRTLRRPAYAFQFEV